MAVYFLKTELAAALLTGAGLWLGQHALVLQKAVRVCLECVGIG